MLDQQTEFACQGIVGYPRAQSVVVQADHLLQQSSINRIILRPTISEGLAVAGQGLRIDWVKNDELVVHERVKQCAALLLQGDRNRLALLLASSFFLPLLTKFTMEPGARKVPLAQYSARRDMQDLGPLLLTQPAELPQLHDPAFARVYRRQTLKRIVQRDELRASSFRHRRRFIQRDLARRASALLVMA